MKLNKILNGNSLLVLKSLLKESVDLVITSPPYFNLRNYDVGENSLGNKINPDLYVGHVVEFMDEVHRVLKKNGSLILNVGDKYYSNNGRHRCNIKKYKRTTHKHYNNLPQLRQIDNYRQWKQLLLLPSRIASKMQQTRWILRNEFIWIKNNAVPNVAKDRSSPATERIYFFVKSKKYFFDYNIARKLIPNDIIRCNSEPFKKHPSSFPEKLIEPFILIMSKIGDVVLDPFSGSGTVPYVARKHNRNFIGIDLSKKFCKLAEERVKQFL